MRRLLISPLLCRVCLRKQSAAPLQLVVSVVTFDRAKSNCRFRDPFKVAKRLPHYGFHVLRIILVYSSISIVFEFFELLLNLSPANFQTTLSSVL